MSVGGEHQEHEPEDSEAGALRLNLTRPEALWLRDVVLRVNTKKKRTKYMQDQIAYGLGCLIDRRDD